ncbi:helix-turn-helix domain-containing protein [Enterococcus faecium]|nr:helix-turn-helix domain-containing protein [Enterococcus faecium]MDQ8465537.1 helix-turn-helix domain-containing protein [Enterococcus faecium]
MDKSDNKDIGNRIKALRISLGLTMEEFGKKFIPAADKSLVSRWEKGTSLPNNERLKRISELGGVSMIYLLEGKMTASDMENAPQDTIFTLKQSIEGDTNELTENVFNYSLDFINNYTNYDDLETWSINNLYKLLFTLRKIDNENLSKNTKDFILILLQNLNFEIQNSPSIDLDHFYKSTLEKTNYPSDN